MLNLLTFNMNDVAILTPYRAQEIKLQSEVTEFDFKNVFTIDKVQGLEKDVIIISFVKIGKKSKLLTNMARLNVAITRAKTKVILVGDMESLQEIDELCKIIEYMKVNNKICEVPEDYIFN